MKYPAVARRPSLSAGENLHSGEVNRRCGRHSTPGKLARTPFPRPVPGYRTSSSRPGRLFSVVLEPTSQVVKSQNLFATQQSKSATDEARMTADDPPRGTQRHHHRQRSARPSSKTPTSSHPSQASRTALSAIGGAFLLAICSSNGLLIAPGLTCAPRPLPLTSAATKLGMDAVGPSPQSCRHPMFGARAQRRQTAFSILPSVPSRHKLGCSARAERMSLMGTGGEGEGEGAGAKSQEWQENDIVVEGVVVDIDEEVDEGGEVLPSSSDARRVKKKKAKPPRLTGEALRDELMKRERQEEEAVMAVNTLFYRARAYKEIDDLKQVWDQSDLSECIRASGSPLKGYNEIIEEFKNDFIVAKKQEKPGQRPFKIRNIKVQTCGTLAWVTCVEDMRNPYKPFPKTVQLVTNVFSKTREGWKLTRHHASDRDVPSQKGGSGGSTTPSLVGGNKGQGASDNSILSHFVDENGGVTELSAKIFKVTDGELKPVDLSELAADLDNDNDGEEGGKAMNGIPVFLQRLIQEKVKDTMSKNDVGAIMRSPDPNSAAAELKKQLQDSINKDLKSRGGGSTSVVVQGARESGGRSGRNRSKKKSHADSDDSDDSDDDDDDARAADELTRDTVAALRKLQNAEKITEREKRLLLADMIRDAVSEGPSLIELAYDVLVKGKTRQDFDPNDCEEFVEQCKAYAGQLAQDEKRSRRRWWNLWKFWIRG